MTDTLIETVRIVDGRAPLWPLHRWRLMNSSLILGLAMPEIEEPSGGTDRILRMEIAADGLHVTERDVTPSDPISLASSPVPHRGYPHKIGSRAWLEAARATGRMAGGDDALLFDAEGRLIEASRWAIGWWDGETLCFPPLTLGGLKSVARARLTEMARSGLKEVTITREELARKDFIACNAARGILSVGMLDGVPLGENPRTAALARRFWDRPPA